MKTITYEQLLARDACELGRVNFLRLFPSGVAEVTEANARRFGIMDLLWLGEAFLPAELRLAHVDEANRVWEEAGSGSIRRYRRALANTFVRLYNAQEES
jgi:hypothetical protein